MKKDPPLLRSQLGADRVLEPPGSLPQPAARLDPAGPVRPYEFEIDVERLCLDSTSYRDIRVSAEGDPDRMAERILAIVAARGKMHNPVTDSGGVLLGTVSAVGEHYASPPTAGDRVVTLASLTLTPLSLDAVTAIDPGSPQVEVSGTAYVFDRSPWARLPEDMALQTALELFDVCSAGSQTHALAEGVASVCVLGAGHAGKLALAAARDASAEATLVAVDVDARAVERVDAAGLCDIAVSADLRDPLAAVEAVQKAGASPADLTVVVVNAPGCEPAAVLLTADGGTVMFFSMATSFSAASLAADGIGTEVRMLIGSGYSHDHGAYALDLLRRSPALREAFAA